MANRSYLYSLSNRPTAFSDRPETISGLAEWAYDVPFLFRLLMSADPQRCASFISDGLDDDEPDAPTPLYAISSSFAPGFERVKRFAALVKRIAAEAPVPAGPAPVAAPAPASFMDRLKGLFGAAPASAPRPAQAAVQHLPGWIDQMLAFLEVHRDTYLLLETIELDVMSEGEGDALRACVDAEIARCRAVGAAFEMLPADPAQAARVLREAAATEQAAPLDAFFGLRFDDDCDSTRGGATKHPLGLTNWSDVLYFDLADKAEFEAGRAAG